MAFHCPACAKITLRSFCVLVLAAGLAGFHDASEARETSANPTSQEAIMTNIDIAKT